MKQRCYTYIIICTYPELDLTEQRAVPTFFGSEKPSHIYFAAVHFGGIHVDNTFPAEII